MGETIDGINSHDFGRWDKHIIPVSRAAATQHPASDGSAGAATTLRPGRRSFHGTSMEQSWTIMNNNEQYKHPWTVTSWLCWPKKQPFSWVSWPKQNLDLDDRLSVSFSFCSAVEHFPPALLSHLGGFFLLVQLSLFSCSLGLCRLLLDLQMSCYFFRLCRQCPDSKKKRNDRKNECTRQKKAQWQMTTHVKTCQNMSKHDM